jgi:hypothetical protein
VSDIQQDLETLRTELLEYYSLRLEVIVRNEELTKREVARAYELHDSLAVKIGALKNLIADATGIPRMGQDDVWIHAMCFSSTTLVVSSLDQIAQATSLALGKIMTDVELGKRDAETGELLDKPVLTTSEAPKAFIAHEGMTGVLTRLREFLEALGIAYSIAEIEASNGRAVEKQVQWTQGKADFAIILATKGKAIDKKTGEPYMGLNVADELGRAREIFGNHIVLLLQRGVKPHTNVRGIVYEPFSPQNLEKSFIKVIRELRNWGFVQVANT